VDVASSIAALEASPVGAWMRGSTWAYPIVNLVHLLGLTLLIGPILLLDLRLLGAGRRVALPDVSSALTPWAVAGLLLLISSGALMFSADASTLVRDSLLQFKLCCIAFGLANALAFRRLWTSRLPSWDLQPPIIGRLQAGLSLTLWLAAGTLGRLLAYK
jgi:hypothetical protein